MYGNTKALSMSCLECDVTSFQCLVSVEYLTKVATFLLFKTQNNGWFWLRNLSLV